VRGDETPAEIVLLAAGMEKALQLFYETRAAEAQDQELKALFTNLAQVEHRHLERLLSQYDRLTPAGEGGRSPAAVPAGDTLEGGFKIREFLAANASYLDTVPNVLDLAMMLETQALDLYLRFARRLTQSPAREVLFGIAEEEKAHLASLAKLLEAKLQAGG
jgi:rubrerythrin